MKLLVRGFEGNLGTSICEAAGVDPNYVQRIVIDLEVGSVGKVYVQMIADERLLDVEIPSNRVRIVNE